MARIYTVDEAVDEITGMIDHQALAEEYHRRIEDEEDRSAMYLYMCKMQPRLNN